MSDFIRVQYESRALGPQERIIPKTGFKLGSGKRDGMSKTTSNMFWFEVEGEVTTITKDEYDAMASDLLGE